MVGRTSREKRLAEVTATARTREQGRRLKLLREARGISKPLLADRLGFHSTQTLELYERGVSVIRADRMGAWADAFEMSLPDFIDVVMGEGNPSEVGWTFRAALYGQIPEHLIDELAEYWEGRPIVNQRAAAEGILQLAAKRRTEVVQPRRQTGT